MVEITGIKFTSGGKMYYFSPNGLKLNVGEKVLVETARGVEMGKVVAENRMVDESEIVSPLKPIIRVATEDDFKYAEENKEKEKEAFEIANEKIAEHKLDMKLVGVEYTFDRSKLLFYFTADGRVDFRELVKTLASVFKTRIELRQIGVRDEARQVGSLGICGRNLCCGTFLNDFHPVSIKMAKEQGLSLNPTKISGVCGRLMCCLQYEQNAYEYMLERMPKRGDMVETPDGVGIVADTATLKGQVKVKFVNEDVETVKFETYEINKGESKNENGKICLEYLGSTKEPEIEVPEIKLPETVIEKPATIEEKTDDVQEANETVEEKQEKNSEHKKNNRNNRNRRFRNRNHKKDGNKNAENKGGYGNGYSE